MQKVFQFWLSLPKRQQPSGRSFETVRLAIEDPLMTAKLSFFSYVASLLEPFLTKYQTNCPMVPYLYTDLTALFRSLMKVIVRDAVLEQCSSGYKLLQINICESNLKSSKDFSIGFVAEGALRNLTKKDLLPKKAKDEFYESVVKCIKTMVGKLKERCPMDSAVVRNAVVFNPATVVNCRESSLVKKLKILLQHLVLLKLIPSRIADTIITQYSSMRDVVGTLDVTTLPALDEFYFDIVKVPNFRELSSLLKIILSLSHGQADVERGFSLNSGALQDNIADKSIVSKRLIKDYLLSSNKKPHTVDIGKELKSSCAKERSRYHDYLDQMKTRKARESKEKVKEILNQEMKELQEKIAILEKSKANLETKFVLMVKAAEKRKDIQAMISEANALKRKSEEQAGEISVLENALSRVAEKCCKL